MIAFYPIEALGRKLVFLRVMYSEIFGSASILLIFELTMYSAVTVRIVKLLKICSYTWSSIMDRLYTFIRW